MHCYPEYNVTKINLYALIDDYRECSREKTYILHDKINEYVVSENLSKRLAYGLIHEIVLELQKDLNCSDELYDLLTNYLDGLEKYSLF